MKYIILVLSFLLAHSLCMAQSPSSKILSETEIKQIFNPSVSQSAGIAFPIYKAYSYSDKSGQYYVVLSEKKYKVEEGTALNDSIKAFQFKVENGKLLSTWALNDYRNKNEKEATVEPSIWFWTKYSEMKDIDGDGLIDPVIVYGTSSESGDDGRIKIFIYYKGQRSGIRYQNSLHDGGRSININKSFYSLPEKIQAHIKEMMRKMESNNQANFPYEYEKQMLNKAVSIHPSE